MIIFSVSCRGKRGRLSWTLAWQRWKRWGPLYRDASIVSSYSGVKSSSEMPEGFQAAGCIVDHILVELRAQMILELIIYGLKYNLGSELNEVHSAHFMHMVRRPLPDMLVKRRRWCSSRSCRASSGVHLIQ